MRFKFILRFVVCLTLTGTVQAAPFEFRVKHDHTLGSCEGKLVASDKEIRYEATNGKHSRTWAYIDIQKVDVASPTRVVLKTFESQSWKKLERDKAFDFSLLESKITPDQQEFLRAKLSRPMVARLVEKATNSTLLLVRHSHRLGGCEGQLSVEEERLIYLTDHASDTRVWMLREIETIGSPDPYHLRVTTYYETFTFDLKSPLDPKVYDSLWKKIYRFENAQASERESLNETGKTLSGLLNTWRKCCTSRSSESGIGPCSGIARSKSMAVVVRLIEHDDALGATTGVEAHSPSILTSLTTADGAPGETVRPEGVFDPCEGDSAANSDNASPSKTAARDRALRRAAKWR